MMGVLPEAREDFATWMVVLGESEYNATVAAGAWRRRDHALM